MPKVQKVRPSNRQVCRGRCGHPACDYVAASVAHLQLHLKKYTIACPLCSAKPSLAHNFYKHFRTNHVSECNDRGGCAKHGVPNKRLSPLKNPIKWLSSSQFTWFKQLLYAYEQSDVKRGRADAMMTNQERHEVARCLLDEFEDRGYREHGDDAGGNVCLQFGKHLWNAVSLDRIDNSLAHFPDPTNPTRNVRFVMAALNNCGNITQFTDVCSEVRARATAASDAAGALFTNRMQKSRRNGKKTKVYTSCSSAAKQDRKRGRNVSGAEMFQKGLAQLCAQSGRCALTGIVFEEERGPFQASLDAVDPSKAHAEEGNLRWVCLFMNRIDRLRDRTYVSNGSSAWTPDRMKTYFGLSG